MPVVRIDDKEVEISLDDVTFKDGEVPTGFVPAAKMASEIQRRVASAKSNARNDFLTDDEFITEVLTAKGIELREDGTVKGSPKDQKAIEDRVIAQHVTPLKEQLEQAQGLVSQLRGQTLNASILEAAREMKVRKGLINDGPLSITKLVQDRFGFDDETGQYGLKDGEGFKYTTDGKLAGARELFAELKSDPNYADLFDSGAMKGPGVQDTPSGGTRTYTRAQVAELSKDPSQDVETWNDMVKAQGEGRITD